MDPIFRSRQHFQNHTGVMTHELVDKTEDIVLARNADIRKERDALKDLGGKGTQTWGRMMATIPAGLVLWAKNNGMDLFHLDKEQCDRNIAAFMATPQGRSCLIQDTKKGSR